MLFWHAGLTHSKVIAHPSFAALPPPEVGNTILVETIARGLDVSRRTKVVESVWLDPFLSCMLLLPFGRPCQVCRPVMTFVKVNRTVDPNPDRPCLWLIAWLWPTAKWQKW